MTVENTLISYLDASEGTPDEWGKAGLDFCTGGDHDVVVA